MKQAILALAVTLVVVGSAFAGVDKYCDTYKSKYHTDLGTVPPKVFIPARLNFFVAPSSFDGVATVGVYQPLDAEHKFRGPTKFRRTCYDDKNEMRFRETVKAKPQSFSFGNNPTQMSFGYRYSFDFKLAATYNWYCVDEIWVKKKNNVAIGDQFYSDRFEADDFDCRHYKEE